MTRLKELLKKADKAAVISMTVAAVAMAALGAGGVKTYASDYSVQKYVDSSKESLILDGDTWHCYKDGQIDYEYDGIALNDYGWWKINNGEVDFSYSGMVLNQYGWWYVNNGGLDGSYSNMGVNEYGWWKFDNGTVDFNYSGIASNEYGWWKFVNGSIDFSANGLNFDEATNTWWYFNGGAIDFAFDGMALNDYGWWKVNNGSVNFGFNGLCSNEYGTWKFNGGTVDFGYNGCFNISIRELPYCNCSFVAASRSELNCVNTSISLNCAKSIRILPEAFFIAFVCAAPPTRDTERPTLTAGRIPEKNKLLSRKICPSVIEITFVGMYADTSPACVSIIGSAVIEPPPSASLKRLERSSSLECK